MQLKPITAIIVLLIVVASLLVSGCTITTSPSPTPNSVVQVTPLPTVSTSTPPADLSSYFNTQFEGGNSIMERPFTKSTNERGNDVYKGIARNSSLQESAKMTIVIELTTSESQAKNLYDQTVAQKIKEGFMARPDWIAENKAASPYLTEVWTGLKSGYPQQFVVDYYYDSYVASEIFVTQAQD